MGKSESVSLGSPSFHEHGAWLKRLARQLVLDESRAEDVVQQSLLIALKHPPAKGRDPRPWLAGIVRNVARKMRRTEVRAVKRERRAAKDERFEVEIPSIEESEFRRKISHLVLEMRESYRTALLLRFFTGLSPVQIAAQEKIPIDTAYKRIQRGLDMLREKLDREFGGREMWALPLLPFALGENAAVRPAGALAQGLRPGAKAASAFAAAIFLVAVPAALLLGETPAQDRAASSRFSADDNRLEVARADLEPRSAAQGLAVASSSRAAAEEKLASIPSERSGRMVEILGRVVDERGQGLSGIRFWMPARKFARHLRLMDLADGGERLQNPERLSEAELARLREAGFPAPEILQSAADGRFTAKISGESNNAASPLLCLLPGSSALLGAGVVDSEEGENRLLVVVTKAVLYQGVVHDGSRPIEGASVGVAEASLGESIPFPLAGKLRQSIPGLDLLTMTKTDPHGEFAFMGPQVESLRIFISRSGFESLEARIPESSIAAAQIRLSPDLRVPEEESFVAVEMDGENSQGVGQQRIAFLEDGKPLGGAVASGGVVQAPASANSMRVYEGMSLVPRKTIPLKIPVQSPPPAGKAF